MADKKNDDDDKKEKGGKAADLFFKSRNVIITGEINDKLAQRIATQLIAWQNKQIDDYQYCEPRLATENRVISAENNPDLTQLTVPSILDNRAGALTYFVAPGDILQNTIRFIGPIELIKFVEGRLRNDIISYVFTAQTANTGTVELVDEEQVISDRTPATFNLESGTTSVLQANVERGAVLPLDFVTASKNGAPVPVSCTPALGSTVPLDILNDNAPTALSCSATADNGVTATLDMSISVVDTEAPIIDTSSLQDIFVEADTAAGTVVNYDYPPASDVWGVDPSPVVACTPDSGSLFPFQAPGPLTTVTCTARHQSAGDAAARSGRPGVDSIGKYRVRKPKRRHFANYAIPRAAMPRGYRAGMLYRTTH